jgi:quercetin dioxygenase-like cupin family protein
VSMKQFARYTPGHLVSQNVLASMLASFREDRNEPRKKLAARAAMFLQSPSRADRYTPGSLVDRFRHRGILGIEDDSHAQIPVTYGDFCFLHDVYEIDWPLLLSALSSPSESVVAEWNDFIQVVNDPSEDRGISYHVPSDSLRDSHGVSVARLVIQPNQGKSLVHQHPGEEIMLVLKGSIFLRFLATGLSVHLAAGSLLHFHSDRLHFATALGDEEAHVVVIRLPRSKRREEHVVTTRRKHLTDDELIQLGRRSWQRNASQPIETAIQGAATFWSSQRQCIDRKGFALLLDQIRSSEFRGDEGYLSIEKLAASRHSSTLGFNTTKYHRLHHGSTKIILAEAISLAPVYNIQSLFVLDFFLPHYGPAIAIDQKDWIPVPSKVAMGNGSSYELPFRRLLDSDTSISRLTLLPNSATEMNRHPGQEFLIPLEGEVTIRISNSLRGSLRDGIAHFCASDKHQVSNDSSNVTRALVIRLYR